MDNQNNNCMNQSDYNGQQYNPQNITTQDNPQGYYNQSQQQNWNQQQQNWNQQQQNWNQQQQNWNQQQQNWGNWQQTQYQNQQNQYILDQFNPNINQTPQKESKRKKPKRKKHRFLKFILFIVLIILSIKGMNYLAEKDMQKFASSYPFIFTAEHNNINYITDDFSVYTQYELNNKNYEVEWKSNSKNVNISTDGKVTIERPSDANEIVTLTQTYKKLLGKATRKYTLNIVATSVIDESVIDVVTLDSVKNNEYNREMTASMTSDGEQLDFLMGDFGNIYIQSADDALVVIEAYRNEFNVPNEIEFVLDTITSSNLYISYTFKMCLDTVPFDNKYAIVTVLESNNKLDAVAIDSVHIPQLSDINTTDVDSLILKKLKEVEIDYYNNTDLVSSEVEDDIQFIILNHSKLLNDNGYVYSYLVVFEDNSLIEIKIQNNEIISFERTDDTVYYYESDLENNNIITRSTLFKNSKELFNDLPINKATCTGYTEKGEKLTFDALYFPYQQCYFIGDSTRNIEVYNNESPYTISKLGAEWMGDENTFKDIAGTLLSLVGLAEQAIANNQNTLVTSKTTEFSEEHAIAAQTYANIQYAYDYYVNTFGLHSFDGNGRAIQILTDCDIKQDNAAWNKQFKMFVVGPSKNWKYSVSYNTEVMGHEYTHAVFGAKIKASNNEISGLNESYADVFGSLMYPQANWEIGRNAYAEDLHWKSTGELAYAAGEEFILRDLKTINSPKTYCGITYPTQYHGEGWTGEEHDISLMVSNIAYKLTQSQYFYPEDIEKIWYEALSKPWTDDTTYVTFRQFIIAVAEEFNYSDEAIDFIATCFDEAAIYDPTYVFKTNTNTIEGDDLYDDTVTRKYITVFPLADMVLGEGTVLFFVENDDASILKPVIKHKGMSDKLTKLFNEHETWGEMNIHGKDLTVEYYVVNPKAMKLVEKFCTNFGSTVKGIALEKMSQADMELEGAGEILDILTKIIFKWFVVEDTAYGIYSNLGLIQ